MARSSYVNRLTWTAALLVILGTSLGEARQLRQSVIVTQIGQGSFESNPDVAAPPLDPSASSILASIFDREKSLAEQQQAAVADLNANNGRKMLSKEEDKVKGGSFTTTAGSASTTSSSKTFVSAFPTIPKTVAKNSGSLSGGSDSADASVLVSTGSTHIASSGFTSTSAENVEAVAKNLVPGAGTGNPRLDTGKDIIPGAGAGNPRLNTGKDIIPGAGAGNPRLDDEKEESTDNDQSLEVNAGVEYVLHSVAGIKNPRLFTGKNLVPGAGLGNPRLNTGTEEESEEDSATDILHSAGDHTQESELPKKNLVPGAGTGNPRFQTGSFGGIAPKKTAGVVEAETTESSERVVAFSDDPATAGGNSRLPGFSGSGVSIDLLTSSSTNGNTILATSRSTGEKSATSKIGLSFSGGDLGGLIVPVPVSVETENDGEKFYP